VEEGHGELVGSDGGDSLVSSQPVTEASIRCYAADGRCSAPRAASGRGGGGVGLARHLCLAMSSFVTYDSRRWRRRLDILTWCQGSQQESWCSMPLRNFGPCRREVQSMESLLAPRTPERASAWPFLLAAAVAGCWAIGCGFRTPLVEGQVQDAAVQPRGDTPQRVPQRHRVEGDLCPTTRGPGPLTCLCPSSTGSSCACSGEECGRDSDCTARRNGRCLDLGPLPMVGCSYDECMKDTDCPSGVPCDCRSSAASDSPNVCRSGSDCRIDSDCGAGGFCSPSLFTQWCGSTYHCHTASDTCLDDGDCVGQGCNFDTKAGHWACGGDCGPPPP
jgi:hypothetical protein